MAAEDYYTVQEAERLLARTDKPLSARRLRQLLAAEELQGYREEETGRWHVAQREVHRLMEERRLRERAPPEPSEGPTEVAEMVEEVRALERQLGRLEGRLELTEKTESTIREERDRLISELTQERAERQALQADLEAARRELEEARRPWWRKLFGAREGV